MENAAEQRPSRWRLLRRAIGIALLVALLGLMGWATLNTRRGSSFVARIAAGEKPRAPAFELPVLWPKLETWPASLRPALADERLELVELRGHPVVVNFWASWCIPCRDEAPLLNASARTHRGEVVFLGINVQDLEQDALKFSREFKTNYVSVRDGGRKTFDDYGLTGVPETYFLDSKGRVVTHIPGAVSKKTLGQHVQALLIGELR